MVQRDPTARKASYAASRAAVPALTTLGLEEADPEDVFELQRKEGAGAFGRVFRACYKADRTRLAALKVIPVALEAGQRGEDIESVRREIQFLRECDHPNVVGFHGAYYKDGALWVAMEHCAGGSVGDVRRGRALSEREISVIMRGALHGLAYLHARRKIHRDVKGGNILLTAAGQVKIADFGVSAQLRDTLSRRGSFVGTPYWMSPELIQDSDYDFKADIWSLGITAIELADQKPPLFDEHPMRVLIQIPRNPPPQVAHPEAWSSAFLDFLRFCLRKDPAERPTALECMQHEFIHREAHIEHVFASAQQEDAVETTTPVPVARVVATAATTFAQDEPQAGAGVEYSTRVASPSEVAIASESDPCGIGTSKPALDENSSTCAEPNHPETRDTAALPSTLSPSTASGLEQEAEEEIAEEIEEEIALGDGAADAALSEPSETTEVCHDNEAKAPMTPFDASANVQEKRRLPPRWLQSSSEATDLTNRGVFESTDGLLDLTVDESFDQEKEANVAHPKPVQSDVTAFLAPETGGPSKPEQQLPPQHTLTSSSSYSSVRHPPTELKLLPAVAKSSVIRSVKYPSDSAKDQQAIHPSVHVVAPAWLSKHPPKSLSPSMTSRQNSFVSAAPTPPPPVRSSWMEVTSQQVDPLASIDAAASACVNRLLSSFSLSGSTSSLVAAMHAYNGTDTARSAATASSRQSFDWRSLEASSRPAMAIPSNSFSRQDGSSSRSGGRVFVGDPFRASHDVCVRYNSLQAQFEGAPTSAEWVALHQQFGIALSHMRCRSSPGRSADGDDNVPALLRMLRRELIRRDGLRCKYVYRVSPMQEEVQRAKAAINRGSFEPAQITDPHVYASLVKLWLRELPNPLLDALGSDDISAVVKLVHFGEPTHATAEDGDGAPLLTPANFDAVDRQVTHMLSKLGAREQAVLDWLLAHILEVSAHGSENCMTTEALATVLAPNVFSVTVSTTTPASAGVLIRQVVALLCVLAAWTRASHGRRSSSVLQEEDDASVKTTDRMAAWRQPQQIGGDEQNLSNRLRQSIAGPLKTESAGTEELKNVSLESMLRRRVEQLWGDLPANGTTPIEFTRQEHVLRRVFYEFQRSMLELIGQYSKRQDERSWADALVDQLDATNQLEATTPVSLQRMEQWVSAALCFTDFRRLLEREQATREKLKSLRTRFGGTACRRDGESERILSGPSDLHNVLHYLAQARRWQNKATKHVKSSPRRTTSNTVGKTNASLIDGAGRLARLRGATNGKGDSGLTSKLFHSIADVGEHQPALGNLLAGIGGTDHTRGVAGEQTVLLQRRLLDMVQSSVVLRHLEHESSSTV